MSNFSSSNPIENIGALEWSSVGYSLADGTLEASAVATSGPTVAPCTVMTCPRIDDDALEASAGHAMAGPTATSQFCQSTQRSPTGCFRIDDSALEVAAVTGPNQTIITYCACPHVDDGELEASAGIVYAGPTSPDVQCIASVKPFCPRYIDDGALEASVGQLHANPTGAGNICNMSGPLMCPRRIDDGVN